MKFRKILLALPFVVLMISFLAFPLYASSANMTENPQDALYRDEMAYAPTPPTTVSPDDPSPAPPCTNHNWIVYNMGEPDPCTGEYYVIFCCTKCYQFVEEKMPGYSEPKHSWVYSHQSNPHPCTGDYSVTYSCSKCGKTKSESVIVGKNDHTIKTLYGKEPNCTSTGLTDGKICTTCNAVIEPQTTIPKKPHQAKCVKLNSTNGTIMETKCILCGNKVSYIHLDPEATPDIILIHSYRYVPTGTTHTEKCDVCGYLGTSKAHNYTEGVVTKEPTCYAEGVRTYTCTICKYNMTEGIPMTEHNYDKGVVTKMPTCYEVGVKTYTCTICKHTKTEGIPMTDHDWAHSFQSVPNPCTGDYSILSYCSQCGASKRENVIVGRNDHTITTLYGKEPTCTSTGLTDGKICTTCNTVIEPQTTIPMAPHQAKCVKWDSAYDTTVETECLFCGSKVSYIHMDPEATPNIILIHSYSYILTGSTHTEKCDVCGSLGASKAHNYTDSVVTKEATCYEEGARSYTCTICKYTISEEIPITGHNMVLVEKDGDIELYCCTYCGLMEQRIIIYLSEGKPHQLIVSGKHMPEILPHVPATCTTDGLTEGCYCRICDEVFVQQEVIPATGHSYVYTSLNGLTHEITCKYCDFTETADHSYTTGSCICGEAEIKEPIQDTTLKLSHSLNLASDISVNLLVPKSLLSGFDMDTVYVEAVIDTYEGNTYTGTTTICIDPVDNGNYYYFTLNGLTAIQMNDMIRSTLYGTKDGQPYYSPVDEYSIATYSYSQMNNAARPQTLKTLCADLLRYGTKAQIFKSYRTDAYADSNMTDTHKSYLSDMEAVTFGNTNTTLNDLTNPTVTWAGKSLNLDSKVELKFVFNPSAYNGNIQDLTLHVNYADMNGQPKTATIGNPELYNGSRGYYAFTFDGLLAAELRSVVSVQIFNGTTPVSCTLQYSADTYGNNRTGTLLELCKALFAYADSAKVYFAG